MEDHIYRFKVLRQSFIVPAHVRFNNPLSNLTIYQGQNMIRTESFSYIGSDIPRSTSNQHCFSICLQGISPFFDRSVEYETYDSRP